MKTAEEWYAENPSLSKIDFGGVIGLIERIQQDAQPVWQPIDTYAFDDTQVLFCRNNGMGEIGIGSSPERGRWLVNLTETRMPTHYMPLPQPPQQAEDGK